MLSNHELTCGLVYESNSLLHQFRAEDILSTRHLEARSEKKTVANSKAVVK